MGQFRKVYKKDTIIQIGCFCFLLTIALSNCVLFTSKSEKGKHNNQYILLIQLRNVFGLPAYLNSIIPIRKGGNIKQGFFEA